MPFWLVVWSGCLPLWWVAGSCGGLVWLMDACPASLGCVFFGRILLGCPAFAGGVPVSCVGGPAVSVVGVPVGIYGEFDSGSGRTLAACLTHASRTVIQGLASGDQWRTGE